MHALASIFTEKTSFIDHFYYFDSIRSVCLCLCISCACRFKQWDHMRVWVVDGGENVIEIRSYPDASSSDVNRWDDGTLG